MNKYESLNPLTSNRMRSSLLLWWCKCRECWACAACGVDVAATAASTTSSSFCCGIFAFLLCLPLELLMRKCLLWLPLLLMSCRVTWWWWCCWWSGSACCCSCCCCWCCCWDCCLVCAALEALPGGVVIILTMGDRSCILLSRSLTSNKSGGALQEDEARTWWYISSSESVVHSWTARGKTRREIHLIKMQSTMKLKTTFAWLAVVVFVVAIFYAIPLLFPTAPVSHLIYRPFLIPLRHLLPLWRHILPLSLSAAASAAAACNLFAICTKTHCRKKQKKHKTKQKKFYASTPTQSVLASRQTLERRLRREHS